MNECICLHVPNTNICLRPGSRVKLGRFDSTYWEVSYGWYTWGGNRPVCGWYLINDDITAKSTTHTCVKPLQLTDLDDIYLIEN